MPHIGLITDSTAQYLRQDFPGADQVEVIQLKIGETPAPGTTVSERQPVAPVFAPSAEELRQRFLDLSHTYNELIVVLLAENLHPELYANVRLAASNLQGRVAVQLIDSQSTGLGLGYLIQAAAAQLRQGATTPEVNRHLQSIIPHIYMIFCTRNLGYLALNGNLDATHAVLGDLLNLAPLFVLDAGRLMPVHKARNARHLVDLLQEFIDEFYQLKQIAVFKGAMPFGNELNQLRERLQANYASLPASEHILNSPLLHMLGQRCIGMFIFET